MVSYENLGIQIGTSNARLNVGEIQSILSVQSHSNNVLHGLKQRIIVHARRAGLGFDISLCRVTVF